MSENNRNTAQEVERENILSKSKPQTLTEVTNKDETISNISPMSNDIEMIIWYLMTLKNRYGMIIFKRNLNSGSFTETMKDLVKSKLPLKSKFRRFKMTIE